MVKARARGNAGKEKKRSGAEREIQSHAGKTKRNKTTSAYASGRSTEKRSKRKPPSKMREKKVAERIKSSLSAETARGATDSIKRTVIDRVAPVAEPSRLLRNTKNTAAALAALEKGIKSLYQNDFKKARVDFKALLEAFPTETEILARARSYLQICNREEAAHKKPAITQDQLYSLGIVEQNRGNHEGAIAYFRQSLEQHREADYVFYSLAAALASKGEAEEAILNLRKAIELNEENRFYAKNDSDFASLLSNREFTNLVGLNPVGASPALQT